MVMDRKHAHRESRIFSPYCMIYIRLSQLLNIALLFTVKNNLCFRTGVNTENNIFRLLLKNDVIL